MAILLSFKIVVRPPGLCYTVMEALIQAFPLHEKPLQVFSCIEARIQRFYCEFQ